MKAPYIITSSYSRRDFCKFVVASPAIALYSTQAQAFLPLVMNIGRIGASILKSWGGRAVGSGAVSGVASAAVSEGLKRGGFTENWDYFDVKGHPAIIGEKKNKVSAQCLALDTKSGKPAMIEGASLLTLDKAQYDLKNHNHLSPKEMTQLLQPIDAPTQNQIGDIYQGYDKPMIYDTEDGQVVFDWTLSSDKKKTGFGRYAITDKRRGKIYKGNTNWFKFV